MSVGELLETTTSIDDFTYVQSLLKPNAEIESKHEFLCRQRLYQETVERMEASAGLTYGQLVELFLSSLVLPERKPEPINLVAEEEEQFVNMALATDLRKEPIRQETLEGEKVLPKQLVGQETLEDRKALPEQPVEKTELGGENPLPKQLDDPPIGPQPHPKQPEMPVKALILNAIGGARPKQRAK